MQSEAETEGEGGRGGEGSPSAEVVAEESARPSRGGCPLVYHWLTLHPPRPHPDVDPLAPFRPPHQAAGHPPPLLRPLQPAVRVTHRPSRRLSNPLLTAHRWEGGRTGTRVFHQDARPGTRAWRPAGWLLEGERRRTREDFETPLHGEDGQRLCSRGRLGGRQVREVHGERGQSLKVEPVELEGPSPVSRVTHRRLQMGCASGVCGERRWLRLSGI